MVDRCFDFIIYTIWPTIWVNFEGPWNEKSWYILWPLCNLVAIWYFFPRFGLLNEEKSGYPGRK
jgi:hypothetical protein